MGARALDQDKLNPVDDVWCQALRRNLLVCGTEGGCIVMFNGLRTEPGSGETCEDLLLKQGHSVVELEFDKYKVPVFKKVVSRKPILSVDVGFSDSQVFVYFRNDITDVHSLVLNKCD